MSFLHLTVFPTDKSFFEGLPIDLIMEIIEYISLLDILQLILSQRYLHKLLCESDPRNIWERLYRRELSEITQPTEDTSSNPSSNSGLSSNSSPNSSSTVLSAVNLKSRLYRRRCCNILLIKRFSRKWVTGHDDELAKQASRFGYERLFTRCGIDRFYQHSGLYEKLLTAAATGGHLHMIELIQKIPRDGFHIPNQAWFSISWGYQPTPFDDAIIASAKFGHLSILKRLCQINVENYGCTPAVSMLLTAACDACEFGHSEIVHHLIPTLLSHWSNVYDEMLKYAARGGHLLLADELIALGASKFDLALTWAAEGGHVEMVEKLISSGATEFTMAFNQAIVYEKPAVLTKMVEMRCISITSLESYLLSAVIYDKFSIVKTLVELGAKITIPILERAHRNSSREVIYQYLSEKWLLTHHLVNSDYTEVINPLEVLRCSLEKRYVLSKPLVGRHIKEVRLILKNTGNCTDVFDNRSNNDEKTPVSKRIIKVRKATPQDLMFIEPPFGSNSKYSQQQRPFQTNTGKDHKNANSNRSKQNGTRKH